MADKPYIGFDNTGIINLSDNRVGTQMLDSLSRLNPERRIQPLHQYDNIPYEHRYSYDGYNLLIGDTYFMIPPEFIMVNSESPSQSIVTLRQENTQKTKSGYHKRIILIDLVFNGLEQINGYPVDGPEGTYYVDGLRSLLAQFKCTPFLPITNELINGMYGIFTVALQSITMSTVQGFPNVMTAQITLQEVNMFPYLQMPDVSFRHMIDWDLFRFYYQSFLTEDHTYKKLQSLSPNRNHSNFKIGILDESVFSSQEATKYNMLQIICDKKIVKQNNEGGLDDTNYTIWVDSNESDVSIVSFQCGYSNILTNIQLSDASSPTVQFMGGMDTIYNIVFETTDYDVVQSLEQCQITNDTLVRGNRKLNSIGFVRLESELVEFTGSLFVMIESVATNTVPGFPGLYNIQMQCVAYDIAQTEREDLNGFLPFDCNKSGRCGEYVKTTTYDKDGNAKQKGQFISDHHHNEQTIEQSMEGLLVKVKQDAYAEWKLRTGIELYPDLRLPTYNQVNKAIHQIRRFRKNNGLTQIPYELYPHDPCYMMHGRELDDILSFKYKSKGIVDPTSFRDISNYYDGFVDPDFYVFYPTSFESFMNDDKDCYDLSYVPKTRTSYTKIKTVTYTKTIENNRTPLIEEFIACARSFIGNTYIWGAEGEISDAKGKCFDCSGLVTYVLKQIGVMPIDMNRLTVNTIPKSTLFEEVPWSEMQAGDVICNYDLTHVVIFAGNNSIIHAAGSDPYPRGGVKEQPLFTNGRYFRTDFNGGRCFRAKAFVSTKEQVSYPVIVPDNSTASTVPVNTGETAGQVWNLLKANGLSDIAAAAILGNMQAESGVNTYNLQTTYESSLGYTDKTYTEAVDSGRYKNFVYDSAGYGLVQFTYSGYKEQLLNEAKARKVSISDLKLQVDVMISQIKSNGVYEQINKALSIGEASNIFLMKYERPTVQNKAEQDKRAKYSESFYQKYKGTSGTQLMSSTSSSGNSINATYTITEAEIDSICRIIMAETKGESSDAEKAVAQVIYDRLTHPTKKFGGLANILNAADQFPAPYQGELNSTVRANVEMVFCKNHKYWPGYQAWYFLTPEDTNATFAHREQNYERLGEIGMHVFWGKKAKGSTVKYEIVADTLISDTSSNTHTVQTSVAHTATTIKEVKAFGRPVLVRTDSIMYNNDIDFTWTPWGENDAKIATNEINSDENIFNTSFCDEVQYSARGKLLRAFPTYLFCVLDDQSQWFDGKKLWTNYYVYKSVVDIAVHATNDMPTETATIIVTNTYHNLDRVQGGMSSYTLSNDDEYGAFRQWFYKTTGTMPGMGPKLTKKLIELHQIICDHAMLREGARIHLRMGYGSDPLALAPVMNGHISDVALGDQIQIVVTSDGHELIQHVTSAVEDLNAGWFGLFGLGESQESSNIIAGIMAERESWVTHLHGGTFEASKYSIEHYGLYYNKTVMRFLSKHAGGAFKAWGESIKEGFETGGEIGGEVGEFIGADIPVLSDITEFAGKGIGYILGAASGFVVGIVKGEVIWLKGINDIVTDIWDGHQEQYDLLKNVYKANYKRQHYIYTTSLLGADSELNVVFNKYNMTPWDVFQVCTQQVPEYIVKSTYHQFDSRLYFGLPFWMEKYRYDYIYNLQDGQTKVFEECKTAAQAHFIDSMDCIIDNQVKVTSKFSNTNIKVMYTRGESAVSTQTIHSDDTIDFSKQKTSVLDTPITQDALGPDAIYELFGYDLGEESARRVGISNLLYGWQQQYQGQMILMGHPGLKPHDYIMINDTFANLYGLATVREVTHSFSTNTGFTTSIVPGMIAMNTDETSGMIEISKNYLMLLNCFSNYTQLRKNLRNNYEKNISIIADIELMSDKLSKAVHDYKVRDYHHAGVSVAVDIATIYQSVKVIQNTLTFTKTLYNMAKTGEMARVFMKGYKTLQGFDAVYDTVKGVRTVSKLGKVTTWLKAVKAGSIATGSAAGGIPGLIIAAVWIVVDILLDEVFEWLSNKNVCALLPLWWEGYPFVAGVKGGRHILLTESNATGTDDGSRD